MENAKAELKDLSGPASIAGLSVVACFQVRKLTGYSLGIESHTFAGAVKAFALITASGGAMVWYKQYPKT